MPATRRRLQPAVSDTLFEQPQRFGFFQAVRVIERMYLRAGVPAREIAARRIRFDSSLALGFPPAEIESLRLQQECSSQDVAEPDAPRAAADASGPGDAPAGRALPAQVHLTPAFIGLLGHSGALPLAYTERLAEREVFHRDPTARAFLDIFNQRAVALFFAGWRKHRPALQYESDGEERFLPLLLALGGFGLPGQRHALDAGPGPVFDQTLAHFAGALRHRPVSVSLMRNVLSGFFRLPVQIEPFVGAWYPIPAAQRSCLGGAAAQLGGGAVAGEQVFQRDLRMRLRFGPLDRRAFDDLLPGGPGHRALARWLGALTGASLEYEVRLLLRAEEVRGASLGAGGARLGFDTFLVSTPDGRARDDAGYLIQPLH